MMRDEATGRRSSTTDELDTIAAGLVGERLTGIRYFETPCFDDSISDVWDADGVHIVSHGVDLILQTRCVGLTWNDDIIAYNLFAVPFSLVDFLLAARFEHVSEKAPWSRTVGHRIRDARVVRFRQHDTNGDIEFPLALALIFENDHEVVLAAASCGHRAGPAFPGGDDIIVIWQQQDLGRLLPDLADIASRWEQLPPTD